MISARLVHRASVERNVATGSDDWGDDAAPDFQPLHADLKCWAYSSSSRESVDANKTALIEDLRIMVALGADLAAGDEITEIRDRQGNVIVEGRLKVEGPVQHKHNHREAALQRIG